jgi:putative membrane protein
MDGPHGWLSVYLKGMAMGAADTVPGVSGGTIALITGIYERLISAVTALDPRVLLRLGSLHTRAGRQALVADLVEMDVGFLLVLGTGILSAVLTLSHVLKAALDTRPALTFAFFLGLIAASALVLYNEVSLDSPRQLAAGGAGLVLALVLTDPRLQAFLPNTPLVVFFAGIVAISAMVLPGVSGSFLLLVLGQYDYLLETVTSLTAGLRTLLDGGDPAALLAPLVVLGSFIAGALVGLLSIAHAVKWALTHYRRETITFLVSLMVGALRLPLGRIAENVTVWTTETAVAVVVAAVVGGVLVLGLDYATDDIAY